jgi:hypothetical protein
MKPRREEQKAAKPCTEKKPKKRFRLIKLEERIAPKHSSNGGASGFCSGL